MSPRCTSRPRSSHFFFFNDTATTEIYTLSLHDALPISPQRMDPVDGTCGGTDVDQGTIVARESEGHVGTREREQRRSEEHTSELQSRLHLVCRLLLEKKNKLISMPLLPLHHHEMHTLLT